MNQSILDSTLGEPAAPRSVLDSALGSATDTDTSPLVTLGVGEIDPRLKLLSHSSRTTLHKCPRKYQLYRLSATRDTIDPDKDREQGVTFAYGHAVGAGIQAAMEGKSETAIYLDVFLAWGADFADNTPRQKKSFAEALFAVQRFIKLREDGYLNEYELVYYKGKPAVELSFSVNLPDGYSYRGYVDAVLRHKKTGEILVLECKTSSSQPQAIYFKNSGQALGYSVVLDILFPELSSYSVLYLVYYTKGREYAEFVFNKSLLQRALWLQELLIDTKHVELYEQFETYPMHGETCNDFFRPCEYFGLCTLNTANLVKPLTEDTLAAIEKKESEYDFIVDFFDLVEAQIAKGDL